MSSEHATGHGERRNPPAGLAVFFAMNGLCHTEYLHSTTILLALCKYYGRLADMNENSGPALAPPGAGLPGPELFIARLLFRRQLWTGSRESFNAAFNREREAISKLYRSCDPEAATRRILIKRLRGMEDSSRNWSVWMTLDHLRIVNRFIAKTIEQLSRGAAHQRVASTANVKPSPAADASVAAEYEASCDNVLAAAEAVPELRTAARYAHPWFGSLDAFGWHAMAGSHMGIHRAQLERIIEGLRGAGG